MQFLKTSLLVYLLSVCFYINGFHSASVTTSQVDGPAVAKNMLSEMPSTNENSDENDLLQVDLEQQPALKEYIISQLLDKMRDHQQIEENDQDQYDSTEDEWKNEGHHEDEQSIKLMNSKRSSKSIVKKEFEQKRNKSLRRQQAAKWDIGFGKRAVQRHSKSPNQKSFLDALYGKRSAKNSKLAFGRKQQWDIRYGK